MTDLNEIQKLLVIIFQHFKDFFIILASSTSTMLSCFQHLLPGSTKDVDI